MVNSGNRLPGCAVGPRLPMDGCVVCRGRCRDLHGVRLRAGSPPRGARRGQPAHRAPHAYTLQDRRTISVTFDAAGVTVDVGGLALPLAST